jgi:hypothetical protein
MLELAAGDKWGMSLFANDICHTERETISCEGT